MVPTSPCKDWKQKLEYKDKDLTPKDQDKDKDLKNVLKESLRTRINIPGLKYYLGLVLCHGF